MGKSEINSIADRVARCADRVRNAGHMGLFRKGVNLSRAIKSQRDAFEAGRLEREYLLMVKKFYGRRFPLGGWILP